MKMGGNAMPPIFVCPLSVSGCPLFLRTCDPTKGFRSPPLELRDRLQITIINLLSIAYSVLTEITKCVSFRSGGRGSEPSLLDQDGIEIVVGAFEIRPREPRSRWGDPVLFELRRVCQSAISVTPTI